MGICFALPWNGEMESCEEISDLIASHVYICIFISRLDEAHSQRYADEVYAGGDYLTTCKLCLMIPRFFTLPFPAIYPVNLDRSPSNLSRMLPRPPGRHYQTVVPCPRGG